MIAAGRFGNAAASSALILPNLLRNATYGGAVVSPDTVPTYMGMTTPREGVDRDIIALGTDQQAYIDIDWTGTGSGTSSTVLMQWDANTGIAAAEGALHCGAVTITLLAGTLANVTTIGVRIRYLNGGGSTIASTTTSILGVSATPTRYVVASAAAPALTTYVVFDIPKSWALEAISFRLRLEGPMLNTGSLPAVYAATTA